MCQNCFDLEYYAAAKRHIRADILRVRKTLLQAEKELSEKEIIEPEEYDLINRLLVLGQLQADRLTIALNEAS